MIKPVMLRPLYRWLLRFLLLLLLWAGSTAWYIGRYAWQDETRQADAAIVLGAAVWNQKPSPVLEERLRHGVELYKKGIVKKLIFTGGYGKGDLLAESEAARDYATAEGVPLQDILIETLSRSTQENMTQASQIMRDSQLGTCLIVSDPLHMRRAMRMMKDLGISCYTSPTGTSAYQSWLAKAVFLTREVVFFTGYLLAGH